MPGSGRAQVSVFPSGPELGASLAALVWQEAGRGTGPGGRFSLALSGGSLVTLLSRELLRAPEPCRDWLWAYCDERRVPPEDPESTHGQYLAQLLSKISIPEKQVLSIDHTLPVEEAAADYSKKLKEAFPGQDIPVFDLLILGLGPDGHTASLFPDHPLLQETQKIVAAISDSPKPPPERITMTLPVLNAARTVVFVAIGEGKASIIKRILETEEENPLPAARVRPGHGKLLWFLDEAAAKELTGPVEQHSVL
ncbi:6-phosphogluconolactonase [Ambystoma mexicanum]|uniref:6-phosphogluconolactonase n=1 Tax=Ambystoma mexicanum TaxID=8296 RepID=UPI0037E715D9